MQDLNRKIIQMITADPQLIVALFKEKGYDFYEKGSFNTNNFGIRVTLKEDDFNDLIGTVYKDEKKLGDKFICRAYEGTTDPGTYYLKNPLNYKGTAILAPGQYKGYKIDKHRGQYDALCQRSGKVKVFRDRNKNKVAEIDLDNLDEGMFGINIHKVSKYEAENDHNKFSAGCQEIMNDAEYDNWMNIQYKAEKEWGNNFTYTLFCMEDDREAFEKVFPSLFEKKEEVGSGITTETLENIEKKVDSALEEEPKKTEDVGDGPGLNEEEKTEEE